MGGESNRPWWQRGVQIAADTDGGAPALSADVLRFQQDLFGDLRRGTGAVVISALLSGLKDGKADANKDGTVTVSEVRVICEQRSSQAHRDRPKPDRASGEFGL